MKFGPLPVSEAEGAVLAHSVRLDDGALKKGAVLSAADVARLAAAGVSEVVAARLEACDAPEDLAAARIAAALAAPHLRVAAAFTGRVNLYAETAGVLRVDAERLNCANRVHEALTIATLPDYARLSPRRMIATVKVIPYAAPVDAVAELEARLRQSPAIQLAPFAPRTASIILTRTPGMADRMIEKGAEAVRARCAALGVAPLEEKVVAHEAASVAEALRWATGDILLILGGSATSDRRDVAPSGIEAAGGEIIRLGMPVDPGNLLVLGRIGARPALGLPGCARSPKLNGADWVLERLVADIAVSGEDIAAMGVGGLLTEIPSRPAPRLGAASMTGRRPKISAILLAAGASRRMGGRNKLLEDVDGEPLARRAARRVIRSDVDETVIVLGHDAEALRGSLYGLSAALVEAADWSEGVAASLRAGLAAIASDSDALLIAFADMPAIDAGLIDRMIAAFDIEAGREIVRARAASGRVGHPVLFGRRFFESLAALRGDVGARAVIGDHPEFLCEILADDEAPVLDLDTPEAWTAWRARR